jgi:hypothetical protein
VLNPDFTAFIESLNDNNVRYLVVGGYVGAIHDYSYPSPTSSTTTGMRRVVLLGYSA